MEEVTKEPAGLARQLEVVSAELAEIDSLSAGLAELRQKYEGVVFAVTTTKGMTAAKAARAEVREPRYKVENARKAGKSKIRDVGKKLDTEAERITAALREIEDPIDAQITAEEERKERERLAKIETEQKRVGAIHERINELRGVVTAAAGCTSAEILEHIADIDRIPVDLTTFSEFQQAASDAKEASLSRLRQMHQAAVTHEADQARITTERAELERLRKEADERAAAERERQAQETETACMRMQEIQGIQHQVMIATSGRLGVRKGGTRECIVETLAETVSWKLTEEGFGPLLGVAESTKASAIAQIEGLLRQWDQRAEATRVSAIRERIQTIRAYAEGASLLPSIRVQEMLDAAKAMEIDDGFAELKDEARAAFDETIHRLVDIHYERKTYEDEQQRLAAQRAELDRIESEQRAGREAEERRIAEERAEFARIEEQKRSEREAEEKRITEDRVQLARDQEALRLQQERAAVPEPEPEPEPETQPTRVTDRPSDAEIIDVLATTYAVSASVVIAWLADMDLQALQQKAA